MIPANAYDTMLRGWRSVAKDRQQQRRRRRGEPGRHSEGLPGGLQWPKPRCSSAGEP
jgi:hypothetical protein